jgi:hypothetical protein
MPCPSRYQQKYVVAACMAASVCLPCGRWQSHQGHQCGSTSGEGPQVNPASSNSSAAPVPVMPGLRDLLLLRLRQVALAPSRGSRLAVPVPVEPSSQGHCHAVSLKPVTSLFPLSFHSSPEKMSERLHLPYMARLCPFPLIWKSIQC